MEKRGIIIFGANGSGKTTLGSELARVLGFKHMDIEDYYFEKSEIPYSVERSRDECLNLMLSDIEKHGSFVLSAVTGDFGEVIPKYYKLAVLLSVPKQLRVARVKQRYASKFGDRVLEGGDMYEQSLSFIEFVSSRTLEPIEQWAKRVEKLSCPVVRIDGTEDLYSNVACTVEQYSALI